MDPIAEWSAAQRRVHELTAGISAADAARPVPACPDWTVRQLLSHMVGLGADIAAGDHPDDHNDAWTQHHVEDRAEKSVAELLAEWDEVATVLVPWMRANDARPMGDVIIHEQDLRGALGVPGGQDTDGLHAIRERMAGQFAERLAGLPTVELRGRRWTWSNADGPADVVIEAPDFELARALVTRRSAAQLRSWTTRGDVAPLLEAFALLGPLPTADLSE